MRNHSVQIKRYLLLALAALVFGSALAPGWHWGERALNAQESSLLIISAAPGRGTANEINHPGPGDAIHGYADILGSALIKNYLRYDMHIAPAGSENWQWIMTDYDVVRNGLLHSLDTNPYPDGRYDLRVRALNSTGAYNESFVRNLDVRNTNPPTPTPVRNAAGTRVHIVYAPTSTPTPWPTPTHESRMEGGRGFYAPASGNILAGYANIIATVNGYPANPFQRYELDISPAGLEEWTWLYSGDQQFWQESIFLLDTRLFPDGMYDLRLRTVFRNANFEQYFLRDLQFANQSAPVGRVASNNVPQGSPGNGMFTPRTGDVASGRVEIRGSAADPNFLRWELYWSPAGAEQWSFATSGDRPVFAGQLATLDLSLLPAGAYDFRLRVVFKDHNYEEYYLRDLQLVLPTPTPLPTLTPTPTAIQ